MSFSADQFLSGSLRKREEQNALRKLVINNELVDFCSNDYLGFARNKALLDATETEIASISEKNEILNLSGSTGSRLLAGNSAYAEELEKKIAAFHHADAGLIYNSGYDANVGLFSAIGQKDTTIIYDELIHASVHDGIRMSHATAFMFRHSDTVHLEERLKVAQGLVYVAVESIYSMDGDTAPLKQIAALCRKYNANLIVDEAHATGVSTNQGRGVVQQLQIEKEVFARIHTFGKALGCHGAAVLGSELLRSYLINFSRAFIYTTALPVKSLVAINQAYQFLENSHNTLLELHRAIGLFKSLLSETVKAHLIDSNSAIQCIVASGNENVKKLALALRQAGFDVRPILSPTVPKGKERLRICIHSFNTDLEIRRLCELLNKNCMR
ncbi:MAG: pyridoxal phosphate-dependent aminotransferase family protein [Bacteroidia bacterium]